MKTRHLLRSSVIVGLLIGVGAGNLSGQLVRRAIDELPVEEERANRSWGPEQATGPPNTFAAGDISTAWASETQDGQMEWLDLTYDAAVLPRTIVIHQTYNPGAVCRIEVYTETGMPYELWAGKDPIEPKDGWGISRIDVEPVMHISRIRVFIDSENVEGWNEIDAVGIEDVDGEVHWASKAEASSTYAEIGGAALGFGIDRGGLLIIDEIKR